MKKVLSILLAALLILACLPAAAAESGSASPQFTVQYRGRLSYRTQTPTVGTTGVCITGVAEETGAELVIPETYNGYPVTDIDGLSDLESVQRVTIPASVERISKSSFKRCRALTAFTVDEENKHFTAQDGVLFTGNSLHTYPAGKQDRTYTLPLICIEVLTGGFLANPFIQTIRVPEDSYTYMLQPESVAECTALHTIVFLSRDLLFGGASIVDCPQDLRLHVRTDFLPHMRAEDAFVNCGSVTICTCAEDAWVRSNALENGYNYSACGTQHETPAFDPVHPVEYDSIADGISYSYLYDEVNGEQVIRGAVVYGRSVFYWGTSAYTLEIPETIGGYPVLEVTVTNDNDLVRITIPKTVEKITLILNINLREIEVDPENPTYKSVDNVLFSKDGKTLLNYPVGRQTPYAYAIPEGTTSVSALAFEHALLRSVTIPSSLTEAPVIRSSSTFHAFYVAPDNPAFSAKTGVLYNKSGTTLMQYPCGKQDALFTIPAQVQSVTEQAFWCNPYLRCIAFADDAVSTPLWNMRLIRPYDGGMNSNYQTLDTLHIPSGISRIGLSKVACAICTDALPSAAANFAASHDLPLYLCNSDHTARTPVSPNDPALSPEANPFTFSPVYDDENTVIGVAVMGLTQTQTTLFDLVIPDTIAGLPVLKLNLADNVQKVAFLRSITVPATVREIEDIAYAARLERISVAADNPFYCDIDGVLFTADRKTLVIYPANRVSPTYAIPDGTERIDNQNAFAYCSGVETLHIPASLTELPQRSDGSYMFLYQNNRIARIEADAQNPAFRSDNLGVLYTKDGSVLIRCGVRNAGIDTFSVPACVRTVDYGLNYSRDESASVNGYTPSKTDLRVLIFEDGMQAIPSIKTAFGWPKTIRTLHIPSSVTKIDLLYPSVTYPAVICSDSADSAAKRFAENQNMPFVLCGGTHDAFCIKLIKDGGTMEASTLIAAKVGSPLGELPIPQRIGYRFLGWFTDGAQTPVTAQTVFSTPVYSLTARWEDTGEPKYRYELEGPTITTYKVGDAFNPRGLRLYKITDEERLLVALSGFTCTPSVLTQPGRQTVTITYEDFVGTVKVDVTGSEPETPQSTPTLRVTGGTVRPGETVQVTIDLQNNPGLAALRMQIGYDMGALTLVSVEDGGLLGAGTFQAGQNLNATPYTVLWMDALATQDYTQNGTLLTLTFRANEFAAAGDTTVTVTVDADSTVNAALEPVALTVENGAVTVIRRIAGDVNGDGSLDLKDVTVLRRYLAGWAVTVDDDAADVNGSGTVTVVDAMLITRFLAGGWDVTLQ